VAGEEPVQPRAARDQDEQVQAVPVCGTCGRAASSVGLAQVTWARGSENGRDVWTCDQCSRAHLRSIEGKLDSAWW
jgi:hypothetical protein